MIISDIRFTGRKYRPQSIADSSSDETESSEYNLQTMRPASSSTSSSDGEESECCPTRSLNPGNKRRVKTGFRSWSKNLSARSNQDNQRDFEEKAMKQVWDKFDFSFSSYWNPLQIVSLVTKKTGISEQNYSHQSYQIGGTFIKLENEWRETIKHRSNAAKILKPK